VFDGIVDCVSNAANAELTNSSFDYDECNFDLVLTEGCADCHSDFSECLLNDCSMPCIYDPQSLQECTECWQDACLDSFLDCSGWFATSMGDCCASGQIDCNGECDGEAVVDCTGECGGSAVDAGCGCDEAGPDACGECDAICIDECIFAGTGDLTPGLPDGLADGVPVINDIIIIVEALTGYGDALDECDFNAANMNDDDLVNVLDAMAIVQVILNPVAREDVLLPSSVELTQSANRLSYKLNSQSPSWDRVSSKPTRPSTFNL
jgi:hypothetical protein